MSTTTETPSLNDAIDDLPIDDAQKRALWRAVHDHQLSLAGMAKEHEQRRRERPPLLELLDHARPFAERLVYREGILPHSVATAHDCTDGNNDVLGEWRERQLAAAREDRDREHVIEDAAYVLGIAVGLQLRGGGR